MVSVSGFGRRVLVSMALAVWSWAVITFASAITVTRLMRLPPGASQPSVVELFQQYVVFQFGNSVVLQSGVDALSVVWRGVSSTVLLLGSSLLFAGVLAGIAVFLVRQGYAAWVRRIGYLGAIPAPVWFVGFFAVGVAPLYGGSSASLVAWIVPAVALAAPLAGFVARVAGRSSDEVDSRSVVLESWLVVNWFVGGVLAVGVLAGLGGVGRYVVAALRTGDVPVVAASVAILGIPVVVLSVLREYLWLDGSGGEPPSALPSPESPLASIGVVALLGIALASFGAGVLLPTARGSLTVATVAPDVLFHLSTAVIVASVVALTLGIPLGLASDRFGRGSAGFVLDAATNVPVFVLVLLVGIGLGGDLLLPVDGWDIGLVTGLATAPLVGRRTANTFADGHGVPRAIPVGLTVAVLGGAFAAFLTVDLAVLELGHVNTRWLLLAGAEGLVPFTVLVGVTALPPAAAFLVSVGLRTSEA